MIDALKAAVEAEKAKLLAELSQAAEPRLSVIRREIAACDSLLARLTGRAPPDQSRRPCRHKTGAKPRDGRARFRWLTGFRVSIGCPLSRRRLNLRAEGRGSISS